MNIRSANGANINGPNWALDNGSLFRIAAKSVSDSLVTYYAVVPIIPLILTLWNNAYVINPYQYFSEFNL